MASKYGGIAVDEPPRSRFGGVPVDDDALAQAQAAPITDLAPVRAEVTAGDVGRGAMRSFGLGARSMLEGGADLVGIVADPFIHGANALGANQATMRQGANALADKLGLPEAQTGTERVSGDVTRALTGGGGLMSLGRGMAAQAPRVVSGIGTLLASQPGYQIASSVGGAGAAGMTRESGGGQGAQLAAGVAGGLTPVGRAGLAATARGAVRGGEKGGQAMRDRIDDFAAVGTTPSVGQAAGNWRMQGVENLLAGAPTSGGVMARFAERQADDIGGGLRGLADRFMPNASAERAGRAVERGADIFAGDVKAKQKALYAQLDELIPGDTKLSLANTIAALGKLSSVTQGAENTTKLLVNPKISSAPSHHSAGGIKEAIEADLAANGGIMPYEAVRALRSRIGEELSDFSLSADRPTAQYKQLYRALSQDLEEAARQQGPQAERAARRANVFTRVSAERLEAIQRVVDKNGGPEKVYAAVMSGTQDGGTTLRAVMQSLPRDGQRAVTAAVIKRMGMATPGAQDAAGEVFSAQHFLTNWNKVSPEARKALFDRHGPGFTQNMDKIARVASRIKDGSKVFANPSGTANKAAAFGYAGSLGVAIVSGSFVTAGGVAAGGAVAHGLARVMTNPKFVNWLAKATEMPVSSAAQQAVILKTIAAQSGDEDLAEFAEALGQYSPQPPESTGDARQ